MQMLILLIIWSSQKKNVSTWLNLPNLTW